MEITVPFGTLARGSEEQVKIGSENNSESDQMPIIKNYGFLWSKRYIHRGTGGGGNAGHLKGISSGKPIADFREQIGVYVLYDRNQQIVYVGQAGNGNATLFTRLRNHMDGGALWNRWEYFTWIGFRDVNTGGQLSSQQKVSSQVSGFKYTDALDEIEGILIEVLEPKLNKQSGRLKAAVEYFQYVDDHAADVPNQRLRDLLVEVKDKLDKLDKAVAGKSTKSKSSAAAKKPAAKKAVITKAATKKPASKKPVAKKPVAKKAVAKKPAAKKGAP